MWMPGGGGGGAFREDFGQVQELHSRALTSKFQELQEASGAGGSEWLGEQPSRGQALMGGQRVQATLCFLGHYTSTWAFY